MFLALSISFTAAATATTCPQGMVWNEAEYYVDKTSGNFGCGVADYAGHQIKCADLYGPSWGEQICITGKKWERFPNALNSSECIAAAKALGVVASNVNTFSPGRTGSAGNYPSGCVFGVGSSCLLCTTPEQWKPQPKELNYNNGGAWCDNCALQTPSRGGCSEWQQCICKRPAACVSSSAPTAAPTLFVAKASITGSIMVTSGLTLEQAQGDKFKASVRKTVCEGAGLSDTPASCPCTVMARAAAPGDVRRRRALLAGVVVGFSISFSSAAVAENAKTTLGQGCGKGMAEFVDALEESYKAQNSCGNGCTKIPAEGMPAWTDVKSTGTYATVDVHAHTQAAGTAGGSENPDGKNAGLTLADEMSPTTFLILLIGVGGCLLLVSVVAFHVAIRRCMEKRDGGGSGGGGQSQSRRGLMHDSPKNGEKKGAGTGALTENPLAGGLGGESTASAVNGAGRMDSSQRRKKKSSVARYSYTAQSHDEISVEKGMDLIIDADATPTDDGWVRVTTPHDGKVGLFPANYLD